MRKAIVAAVLLLCVIAVEAAFAIPAVLAIPKETDANTTPMGQTYLTQEGELTGVTRALSASQALWQAETTTQVSTYIVTMAQSEQALRQQTEDRTTRQKEFLEEQVTLQQQLNQLREELKEKNQQQFIQNGGIGQLDDQSNMFVIQNVQGSQNRGTQGATGPGLESGSIAVTTPNATTVNPTVNPTIPEEGMATILTPSAGVTVTPGTAGSTTPSGSGVMPTTPTAEAPKEPTLPDGYTAVEEPKKTADQDAGEDGDCGQFTATFVCTCANCFDPKAWPAGKLAESYVLADPTYLSVGISITLTAGSSSTFKVKDAEGAVEGRNLLVFTANHSDGGGTRILHPTVYKVK